MQHQAWYVDDITLNTFNELDDAKRYEPKDVVLLLDWFNEAQKLWGIYEVIRLGILRYSKAIIDEYRLAAK